MRKFLLILMAAAALFLVGCRSADTTLSDAFAEYTRVLRIVADSNDAHLPESANLPEFREEWLVRAIIEDMRGIRFVTLVFESGGYSEDFSSAYVELTLDENRLPLSLVAEITPLDANIAPVIISLSFGDAPIED
ncbi:MAG: hypothetical protein LBE35_08005 [Clostridiales bacterium]|jgi:hypothetical protein|nr:hypothetical protein [Clostridiales bacterium]